MIFGRRSDDDVILRELAKKALTRFDNVLSQVEHLLQLHGIQSATRNGGGSNPLADLMRAFVPTNTKTTHPDQDE